MSVHTDLDEGTHADLCCIACHGEEPDSDRALLWMTAIYGVVSLNCEGCGEELVRWQI